MKLNRNSLKAIHWLLVTALTLSVVLSSSPIARADDFVYLKHWTTVGSAGTLDEADTGKLVFQGSTVAFPEILPPLPTISASANAETNAQIALPTVTTSATLRYNVTAVDGLFEHGSHLGMTVRYRDDGGWAQVLVRVYEQDIYTGATALLLSFDSNAFGASPNYQTQGVSVARPNWGFDFNQKAYFIEATLTKTSSAISINGGRPGLAIIKLNRFYPIS